MASLRIPSKEAGHSGECQEAATYSRTMGPSLFPSRLQLTTDGDILSQSLNTHKSCC